MAGKQILAHVDDVGVSRGSVIAWTALRAAGVVRSASVMVPCPWYRAAVDDWHADPDQDLGVHVTLTAEWSAYRWRPMTGPVKGLTDNEGFFHHRPEAVAAHADRQAVADEIAAQIERALADGIRPTHLDAHMGTAYLPKFVRAFLDASERYGIPVMMCRDFGGLTSDVGLEGIDDGYVAEIVDELTRRGNPVFDSFLMGFCPEDVRIEDHYGGIVDGAGDGFHWLAMHANAGDDTPGFAPHMVSPRLKEYELFSDAGSAALFAERDAVTRDWRELGDGPAR